MRLMVLTAGVFPSEEDARSKMWIFLRSAERFRVSPEHLHIYGIGKRFGGYRHMKLECQLEYLQKIMIERPDYTHVLFSDGWDAFFVAPLLEIIEKYEEMDSPPILSAAWSGLANVSEPDKDYPGCFDESKVYRYPHVGGYIAEIPAIVDAFERMLQQPEQTGDDCFNWYRGWKEGWFRPQLDSNCHIFQVTSDKVAIKNGRLTNLVTGSHPCIFHLSGGYTDQVTGKDDRLIPWAKELRIIE